MSITTTGAGAVPFSPSQLPQLLYFPVVSLMRQQSKLWQDAGQTTLAVADGDPVYVAQCTFTGILASAQSLAARQTLTYLGNGKWGFTCTSAAATVLRATVPNAPQNDAPRTLCGAGTRTATGNAIYAHYGTVPIINGSFGVNAASSVTYHYRYGNDLQTTAIAQGIYSRLEFTNVQGVNSVGYVNGVQVGTIAPPAATAGNVYEIGGRTEDSNYSDCIIVASGLTGAVVDPPTLALLDAYLASLCP